MFRVVNEIVVISLDHLIDTKKKEVFKVYLLEQESNWWFYQDRMNTHLSGVPTSDDLEQEWDNIKHIIIQAAKEPIGVKGRFRPLKDQS